MDASLRRIGLLFVLLFSVCLAPAQPTGTAIFYLPPFIKLPVDTAIWSFIPKTYRALPFFRYEYIHLYNRIHLKDNPGAAISLETKYYPGTLEEFSKNLTFRDYYKSDSINTRPANNWVMFVKKDDQSVLLLREFMPNCCVWVKSSFRNYQQDRLDQLLNLLSKLEVIEPSFFDKTVGYPIPENANPDSLRAAVRNDYKKYLTPISAKQFHHLLNDSLSMFNAEFDTELFFDWKLKFSYQAFHDQLLRDARHSLTQEEMLQYWFAEPDQKPFAILAKLKVSILYPLEMMNHGAESYSPIIDRNILYKRIWKLERDVNRDIKPMFLSNDSAWTLLLASKTNGKWDAQHISGKFDYYPSYLNETRFKIPSRRNSIEYIPDQPRKDYFMIRETKFEYRDSIIHTIPDKITVYVSNNPMLKPAVLNRPKGLENFEVIIDFFNEPDSGMLAIDFGLNGSPWLPRMYLGEKHLQSRILRFERMRQQSEAKLAKPKELFKWKTDPQKKLLITPVQETDLNGNGKREIWRAAYAANKMVFIEVFELSKNGWEAIRPDEALLSKMMHYPEIQQYVLMSNTADQPTDSKIELQKLGEGISNAEEEPSVRQHIPDVDFGNEVLSFASIMPEYPGGEAALNSDLYAALIYPETEKENNIQGVVYLSFVIEKNGFISNIKIERSVSGAPGFSKAAINAVKKLKPFKPAMQNGIPVRLKYNLPIKFVLK